jgi:hypothetical protein
MSIKTDPNPRKSLRKHINFLHIQLARLKRREIDILLERDRLLDIEAMDPIEECRDAADNFAPDKWRVDFYIF